MQKCLTGSSAARGERVSAIGLGGWHLGFKKVDEQLSIRIIRDAIQRGINFMDNCWDYNDGASETRMGKAPRRLQEQGISDDQDRRPFGGILRLASRLLFFVASTRTVELRLRRCLDLCTNNLLACGSIAAHLPRIGRFR
jgi:hypothetical protein